VEKEPKTLVVLEMGDVLSLAREKVVHAEDLATFLQQALAEMGTQETGAAGDYRDGQGKLSFQEAVCSRYQETKRFSPVLMGTFGE
jgi:hypothetical protein